MVIFNTQNILNNKHLVLMGLYIVFLLIWPTDFIFTQEFYDYSYLYKMWYVVMTMHGRRFQFYSVFRFMELGCVASGMGYKGKIDGKDNWETVVGAYGMVVELTNSP